MKCIPEVNETTKQRKYDLSRCFDTKEYESIKMFEELKKMKCIINFEKLKQLDCIIHLEKNEVILNTKNEHYVYFANEEKLKSIFPDIEFE